MSVISVRVANRAPKRLEPSRRPEDLAVSEVEAGFADDCAGDEGEEVWCPFSPGAKVMEDPLTTTTVELERTNVVGVPVDNPVELPLDSVTNTELVGPEVLAELSLVAELGGVVEVEAGMEFGPPVAVDDGAVEEVTAAETRELEASPIYC